MWEDRTNDGQRRGLRFDLKVTHSRHKLRRTVAAPQFACIFHFRDVIDGSGSFIALDGATACRGLSLPRFSITPYQFDNNRDRFDN
jgi:hypothetical protein